MVGATGTNLRYQWQAKGSGSWFDLEDNDAYSGTSWAVGVGLIGGSGEKDGLYLLTGGNALRCQVAAISHRFCVAFKAS